MSRTNLPCRSRSSIGQSAVPIFGLQALGLWALSAHRPWLGGLALGAVVLKPHLLAVELPALLSAPRRAWAGAALAIGGLLLGPELLGIHLLGPFLRKLLPEVGQERYNKLNPADLFASAHGVPMMPWPLNRTIPMEQFKYYTWRDTSIRSVTPFSSPRKTESRTGTTWTRCGSTS